MGSASGNSFNGEVTAYCPSGYTAISGGIQGGYGNNAFDSYRSSDSSWSGRDAGNIVVTVYCLPSSDF